MSEEKNEITIDFIRECVVVGLLRKDPRNMMKLKAGENSLRVRRALKNLESVCALANFGLQINQRVFGKKGVK